MRSRSLVLAVGWTLLCAAGAVSSGIRGARLRSAGESVLSRSQAHADAYASSFDERFAEQQLASFAELRAVAERAQIWQRAEVLLILAAVIGAFASWMLLLLHRVRDSLEHASDGAAR